MINTKIQFNTLVTKTFGRMTFRTNLKFPESILSKQKRNPNIISQFEIFDYVYLLKVQITAIVSIYNK